MDRSMFCAESLKWSCRLQRKQNMGEFSSTPRKVYQSARRYKNSATNSQKPEHLSKQITPQRTVLYTITYAKRNRVFFTRDSTGSVIVPSNANSTYNGSQAQTTKRITSPNTTPLTYTNKCVQLTFMYHRTQHPYCEGVLILGFQLTLNRR